MKNAQSRLRVVLSLAALSMALLPWSDRPDGERTWANEPVLLAQPTNAPSDAVPSTDPDDPNCLVKDPPPPVLKVRVRVPSRSTFEQTLVYKICVENVSKSEAHHVVVKHALPASVRLLKADPEPAKSEPELQWNLGTVGGGAAREICLYLQPLMRDDIKNCTRVQFEHGVCLTTRIAGSAPGGDKGPRVMPTPKDGVGPDGKDSIPFPPIPPIPPEKDPKSRPPIVEGFDTARLLLAINGDPAQYLNRSAKYLVTVSNLGSKPASNLSITANLPDDAEFGTASDQGISLNRQVVWVIGNLDAGRTKTVEMTFKAKKKGRFCVKFKAEADQRVVAFSEACTEFVNASALHMEIQDTKDPIVLGDKTSFPILVRNQGDAPITNVIVKVFSPKGLGIRGAAGPSPKEQQKDGPETPQGKWLEFGPYPELAGGKELTYRVDVDALAIGDARFHVELRADQLESGPVIEQESTTVYADKKN